jgi:hypothetical protein
MGALRVISKRVDESMGYFRTVVVELEGKRYSVAIHSTDRVRIAFSKRHGWAYQVDVMELVGHVDAAGEWHTTNTRRLLSSKCSKSLGVESALKIAGVIPESPDDARVVSEARYIAGEES